MIKARNFRNISRNGERGCLEGQEVGNTMATPVGRDSVKRAQNEAEEEFCRGERVLRKRAQNEAEERFCRGEAITDGVSF